MEYANVVGKIGGSDISFLTSFVAAGVGAILGMPASDMVA